MGDFSNYAEQGLGFGRTVPYEVTELRNADGTHPLLHVEHIGRANVTFLEEIIARAGSDEEPSAETTRERVLKSQDAVIKHGVRRLERVYFADGSPASDKDIPGFVRAMPHGAFDRLFVFVVTEGNFYKHAILAPPDELAEK